VAALVLFAWLLVRRHRYLAFSAVHTLLVVGRRGSPLRTAPRVLVAVSLVLLVLALMEPVLPYAESKVEAQGLDIVLVLDLSSSMADVMGQREGELAARTVGLTRLEVTKRVLRGFIDGRRDDRIGLVVFASSAYVISPLTFDYGHLTGYVSEISGDLRRETPEGHVLIESGTAIGEGIHLANVLLARQSQGDGRNKVIVVFTDGESNSGRDPVEALDDTDKAGVRVHLIGIDLDRGVRQKPPVVRLIHSITRYGGRYFHAESAPELRAASAALASVEKGRLVGRRIERNVPVFRWFATPALVLIGAAMFLRVFPYFSDVT
jgi:Ca-activated chloride channel family protein